MQYTLRLTSLFGLAAITAGCGDDSGSATGTLDAEHFTVTAIADGNWNDAGTWDHGVPVDDDRVLIPAGRTVALRSVEPARLALVDVAGTLELSHATTTQLLVETLDVEMDGALVLGNAAHPLAPDRTAEIVFIDRHGDAVEPTVDDRTAERRGLVAMGAVQLYGAAKTPYVELAANLRAGASTLPVARPPGDWRAGDRLVVPSTHFRQTDALENEVVTITAVRADRIDVAPALRFDHGVARNRGMALRVANLDRNVRLRSESARGHHRGHVMLMDCTDTVIEGALFADLGRTDKTRLLDDPVWDGDTLVGGTNPRARYPLHFHQCGLDQGTAIVRRSVVWGTPGWGAVNHDSRVDFDEDVVYDFTGAGFVAENGDELGRFDRDTAIGGTGDVDAPLDERFELRANYKKAPERVAQGDFGFQGDAFWLQSPSMAVTDCVAAGSYGQGFLFHTVGLKAYAPVGMPADVVAGELGVDPAMLRHWLAEVADPTSVMIQDLPIQRFDRNAAYGNFEGLKFRYTQGQNLNLFGEFDSAREHDGIPSNLAHSMTPEQLDQPLPYPEQRVTRSWFWNNAVGINISYTDHVTYDQVFIGTDEPLGLGAPPRGACGLDKQVWVGWEGHDSSTRQELRDVTFQGYPIPVLEQDADATTITGPLHFIGEDDQVCGTVVDGEEVTGVEDFCYCDDKLVRK